MGECNYYFSCKGTAKQLKEVAEYIKECVKAYNFWQDNRENESKLKEHEKKKYHEEYSF